MQVLRHLPAVDDPRALVTALTRDDAAVYRLSDTRAIVATVDFFTPIVDDPYTFGAIAATNALSDLYAMGATPLFALNIVAWPRDAEILELVADTVRGAVDKAREAGMFVLGGHSIEDREPKFGMVALGEVHPDHLLTNQGARPDDRLVLTKPVGTGVLATALKHGTITETDMAGAITAMTTLNAGALEAVRSVGDAVHAVTDVTGFGLMGHAHNLVAASGVAARLFASRVPVFPRVPELVRAKAVPGGTTRNADAANAWTRWSTDVDPVTRTILCDAQTSGGLLIAVAPDAVTALIEALERAETPTAAIVGHVLDGRGDTTLEVVRDAS